MHTGGKEDAVKVGEEEKKLEAIRVEGLSKTFQVKRKEKGMRGAVKAILHPLVEKIRAVELVSFSGREGVAGMWRCLGLIR